MMPGAIISVACRVSDIRQVFGRFDVEVTPFLGSGKQWISVERLILNNELESE
jgi:hypothetical protein